MSNLAIQQNIKPILKQPQQLKLKSISRLESIHIFAMPTRIRNTDITAMFNGLLALIREKSQQEQSENIYA
ncbi:MAG: hypothetical protein J6Q15_01940 [Clostridia bacterium]|nr:hypothetical protein [Clostridia bacterium]